MDSAFDPYHLWLGIPPHDQPPDAYRLLGINRFESDPNVIDNAVQLQVRHLAAQQNGPHASMAAKLIQSVRQAGSTLLNPQLKTQYDARLQATLASQPQHASPLHSNGLEKSHMRQSLSSNQMGILIACGVAAMLIGMAGVGILLVGGRLNAQRELAAEQRNLAAAAEAQAKAALEQKQQQRKRDRQRTAEQSADRADRDPSQPSSKNPATSGAIRHPGAPSAAPSANSNPFAQPTLPANNNTGRSTSIGIGNSAAAKNTPSSTPPAALPTVASPSPASTEAKPAESDAPASNATTATTATNGDPFALWPKALELPSLLVKQPRSLVRLDSEKRIELELRSEFADLPDGKSIVAAAGNQDDKLWRVLYTDGDNDGSANGEELAQLFQRDGELQFLWTPNAPLEHAHQVQNCVLQIASDKHFRELPLRKAIEVEPMTISLQKKIDVRVLDLPHPPKTDQLQLQVEALGTFPVPAAWKENQLQASKGKYLAIQLTDHPGAEIRLKVDKKGRDQVALYVMPVYEPNARIHFDLSLDRLRDMEEGTKRALLGAQRDLVRTGNKLTGLSARQRSINAQRPVNAVQRQTKASAQFDVQRDIAAANRKSGALKVKIAEMEARLKALPKTNQVVNKIHNQAKVRLQVVCVGEHSQLPLYAAKGVVSESSN